VHTFVLWFGLDCSILIYAAPFVYLQQYIVAGFGQNGAKLKWTQSKTGLTEMEPMQNGHRKIQINKLNIIKGIEYT
jgi:hypothetical protein